jgi:hypothetical protein
MEIILKHIKIVPDTRMNTLEISIPLSNWALKSFKRKLIFDLKLSFGAHDNMDFINELVNFIDKDMYASYAFVVMDKKSSITLPIASKDIFDSELPICISSMERGGIINSAKCFNFTLIFSVYYKDFLRLLRFLEKRTHKDLEYEIVRTKRSMTTKERLRDIKKQLRRSKK